jgi:hypothetical protein
MRVSRTAQSVVKNDAALQKGILTCVTPADTCVSGVVIGSFCLDLINGIALSVGAVSLVVAVIAARRIAPCACCATMVTSR